jgi:hypothetical protein
MIIFVSNTVCSWSSGTSVYYKNNIIGGINGLEIGEVVRPMMEVTILLLGRLMGNYPATNGQNGNIIGISHAETYLDSSLSYSGVK